VPTVANKIIPQYRISSPSKRKKGSCTPPFS
jgi:hypothetical protein